MTNEELRTIVRMNADEAARRGRACIDVGDTHEQCFEMGRQAAFLTVLNLIREDDERDAAAWAADRGMVAAMEDEGLL